MRNRKIISLMFALTPLFFAVSCSSEEEVKYETYRVTMDPTSEKYVPIFDNADFTYAHFKERFPSIPLLVPGDVITIYRDEKNDIHLMQWESAFVFTGVKKASDKPVTFVDGKFEFDDDQYGQKYILKDAYDHLITEDFTMVSLWRKVYPKLYCTAICTGTEDVYGQLTPVYEIQSIWTPEAWAKVGRN